MSPQQNSCSSLHFLTCPDFDGTYSVCLMSCGMNVVLVALEGTFYSFTFGWSFLGCCGGITTGCSSFSNSFLALNQLFFHLLPNFFFLYTRPYHL